MAHPRPVIVLQPKSVLLALLLSFLFGPLGMLYSTVIGALVMVVLTAVVSFLTLGIGYLLLLPVCMVWAAVAAAGSNTAVIRQAAR